jgi:sugar/nucleoside kinase (ribokinase family)
VNRSVDPNAPIAGDDGEARPIARPDAIVVGSAARDVTAADRRGWRLGGGVTYGALTLARLGLRVGAVVGVDEPGSAAVELDLLREAGADVRLVHLERTPVFENVETSAGRVQTCLEPGQPLPVEALLALPPDWQTASTWLLAPVADELPDAWALVPPPGATVGLGWQGILRELGRGLRVTRRPPRPSALISRADVVGVSHQDVDPGTEIESLSHLLHPGATLLVTEGPRGGWRLTISDDGPIARRRYPSIAADREVDPTGAGDVFLAAYLASGLIPLGGSRRRGSDLRLAAAAASHVIEGPGLRGVPTLSQVARRLAGSLSQATEQDPSEEDPREQDPYEPDPLRLGPGA